MRVWDVNPGYLNRQSLLGEHREIHALLSILSTGKKGYANHPETLRWRTHLWALDRRHDLVAAEMGLRGYNHQSPGNCTEPGAGWPDVFVDSPVEQFDRLAEKYAGRERGRIPLPSSAQNLWAQHKYSVLARSPTAYREIGARLALVGRAADLDSLSRELIALLRISPTPGGVRNALEHLWGYVSAYASPEERATVSQTLEGNPSGFLRRVYGLAAEHQIAYVVHSTALNDLVGPIASGDGSGGGASSPISDEHNAQIVDEF